MDLDQLIGRTIESSRRFMESLIKGMELDVAGALERKSQELGISIEDMSYEQRQEAIMEEVLREDSDDRSR